MYNLKIAKLLIGYIWITYVIYLILPLQPVDLGLNETYSVIFLSAVSIAIFWGCYSVKIRAKRVCLNQTSPLFKSNVLALFQCLIIIVTLGYIIDLFASGLGGITLSFGENYEKMLLSTGKELPLSVWGQWYVLLSPLRYLLISYGAYCFNSLNKLNKFLYLALIAMSFSHSVFGLGTQKGVGDIVIIIVVTLWIKALRTHTIKRFKKNAIIISVLFVAFFSYMQASRSDQMGYGGIATGKYRTYEKDNLLNNLLGKDISDGLVNFGSYISNGYPGLNYCLQMPFEWTYGYGGSRACNDYFNRYLGLPSEFNNTYPLRMERDIGWPGLMFWPTAFAWWASDLTWPGVVLLMYIFAHVMCIMFKEAYYYNNLLSIAVLAYLSIGVIYLPANNQLMQSNANFVSTVVLLILWAFKHKKFNNYQ